MISFKKIIGILLVSVIAITSAGCSKPETKHYYYAERLKYELAEGTEATCFDLYKGDLYEIALDLGTEVTDSVKMGIYSGDGKRKGEISIRGIDGYVPCFDILDGVIYLASVEFTNKGTFCYLYSADINGGDAEKIYEFENTSDIKKVSASNDGNIYFLTEKRKYERYSDVLYLENGEAVSYDYTGEAFGSCGYDGGNYTESDIAYPVAFDERNGTVIVCAFDKENGFYFQNYKTKENIYTNKLGNITDIALINDNNDFAAATLSGYNGTLTVSGITDESGILQLDDSMYYSRCGSICAENDELCVNALRDPYDEYRSVFKYDTSAVNTAAPPVRLIFSSYYEPLFSCGSQIKNDRLSSEEFALSVLSLDQNYDLMMMDTRESYAENVKAKGSFYPLNDVPGVSEYIEKCFPSVRDTAVDDNGDIWMLPLSLDVGSVIYNAKNCADKGVTFSADLSDFVAQIEEISDVSDYYNCLEYLVTEAMLTSYLSENNSFDTEKFRTFAPILKDLLNNKAFEFDPNTNVSYAIAQMTENKKIEALFGYSDDEADKAYQKALFTTILSSDDQRRITEDENLLAAPLPYVNYPCSICSFVCVNPNSAHLEETLAYVERLTSYLSQKNESYVFDNKDCFGDTPLGESLYDIYANSKIYFQIPSEVYYTDFGKYRAGEITLDEFITEADRKLSAYLNE